MLKACRCKLSLTFNRGVFIAILSAVVVVLCCSRIAFVVVLYSRDGSWRIKFKT